MKYDDGRFVFVQTCENHPNCNTMKCNGCQVIKLLEEKPKEIVNDENQVIESIKGLIEALQKYDADVLKHEKVQSEIVDLKEAFDSKDIPLSTCVVDEPPSHWEFFGLDDVGFNLDLEVDFGEEEPEDWIDFDFSWF